MDAAAKRDLHDAIWRSSGGFDLVLAPVLIALLGLWIDSAAGTRPVFMLAFLAFGTVGAVLKVYYDYQRGMAEAAEHVAAVRRGGTAPSGGSRTRRPPGPRPHR